MSIASKLQAVLPIQEILFGGELERAVNARDLWQALEIGKDYSSWIKYQIESLDLEENMDYIVFTKNGENPKGGRPAIEYILTLDAAKHIAMASKTVQGKKVRQYFIEVEKRVKVTRYASFTLETLREVLKIFSNDIIAKLVYELREMEDRIVAHKRRNQYAKEIAKHIDRLEQSKIEAIKALLELYPEGIHQSRLLRMLGRRKDDKSFRHILHKNIGKHWRVRSEGRLLIYLPMDLNLLEGEA